MTQPPTVVHATSTGTWPPAVLSDVNPSDWVSFWNRPTLAYPAPGTLRQIGPAVSPTGAVPHRIRLQHATYLKARRD